MSDETALPAEAWERYWAEKTHLSLGDTPAYPLARRVAMPEGHPYESGAIGIRLHDLKLTGMERLDPAGTRTGGNSMRLRLHSLRLDGRYILQVKPDPVSEVDSGGDLLELPPDASQPDAGVVGLDEEKEEWLDQARNERTRLAATENGSQLLLLYARHNEVYEEVFHNNSALQRTWTAGGATREMAAYTHAALRNDDVLNPAGKLYGGQYTYNYNAFRQSLAVATACLLADPNFDPYSPELPPESRYTEAAKAVAAFRKGVVEATGNQKDEIREMTASNVYRTVEAHQGGLPELTLQEVVDLILKGLQGGRVDSGTVGGGAGRGADWARIDEDDRAVVGTIVAESLQQRAGDVSIKGQPFYEGRIAAVIDSLEALVTLDRTGTPVAVDVELPDIELNIDDSGWEGAIATVARQRLQGMRFVRQLLHSALAGEFSRALQQALAATLAQG